jgi:hypothetical protein
MTLIYPIFAAVICAVIEFIRIMKSWGVPNVNKLWTITIGVIFFIICLALSVGYYDNILLYHVLIYAMYFSACRGLVYDILLNTLRGLPVDYKSKSTNSKLDQMLIKFDFWLIKAFYLVLGILSGMLWIRLK